MSLILTLAMRKVRGVRVVNLIAAACLMLTVLIVYWSKASAGAEGAQIADTNRKIALEEQQVRELQAVRARLTRPERLRLLSAQYLHMAPVSASRETTPEGLLQRRQAAIVPPAAAAPEAMR